MGPGLDARDPARPARVGRAARARDRLHREGQGRGRRAGGGRRRERERRLLRRADAVHHHLRRHHDRARGDLRPGAGRACPTTRSRRSRAARTTPSTGSRPACGRATSARRTGSPRCCGPAPVYVNIWGLTDPAAPFGGFKASGIGREHGHAGPRRLPRDEDRLDQPQLNRRHRRGAAGVLPLRDAGAALRAQVPEVRPPLLGRRLVAAAVRRRARSSTELAHELSRRARRCRRGSRAPRRSAAPSGPAGPSRCSACPGCRGTRRRSPSSRPRRPTRRARRSASAGRGRTRSMPSSRIASTTSGCTRSPGVVPAERASCALAGRALEQRLAHLRAAGVVQADEQHVSPAQASMRGSGSGRLRRSLRAPAGRRARRSRLRRSARRRRSRSRSTRRRRAPGRTSAPGSSTRR